MQYFILFIDFRNFIQLYLLIFKHFCVSIQFIQPEVLKQTAIQNVNSYDDNLSRCRGKSNIVLKGDVLSITHSCLTQY